MRWVRDIKEQIKNLIRWNKVVRRYRWYDYGYSLDIIAMDLEIRISEWDKAHYVGSEFTKKRMQVLLRWHREYRECYDIFKEDNLLKRFVNGYARLLPRLWD